jgi:RNA polymerase sigma-70 factor (ECF subfamily)
VNGSAGAVVILHEQPVAVVGFTFSRGKVAAIDIIADPERLRRFDLASLA